MIFLKSNLLDNNYYVNITIYQNNNLRTNNNKQIFINVAIILIYPYCIF